MKLHTLVDALGNPLRFLLSPGQGADTTSARRLIQGGRAAELIADRGYDCDAIVALLSEQSTEAVIQSRKNRIQQRVIDRNPYCNRNKIERFFAWVKQVRRIASCYEKTASSYLAMLHMAGAICRLR